MHFSSCAFKHLALHIQSGNFSIVTKIFPLFALMLETPIPPRISPNSYIQAASFGKNNVSKCQLGPNYTLS